MNVETTPSIELARVVNAAAPTAREAAAELVRRLFDGEHAALVHIVEPPTIIERIKP